MIHYRETHGVGWPLEGFTLSIPDDDIQREFPTEEPDSVTLTINTYVNFDGTKDVVTTIEIRHENI